MTELDDHSAGPWPRIGAWLMDWLFIAIYLAVLAGVGYLAGTPEWDLDPLSATFLAFAVSVLPVVLWLAWWEAGPRSATPGKRLLHLRVVAADGGAPIGFGQALVRNAVKVGIPWQLGHVIFAWFAINDPAEGMPFWLLAVVAVDYVLMFWFLGALFVGQRRPPYDRFARSRVIRAPAGAVAPTTSATTTAR